MSENLFQYKIELFSLPEVIQCKDTELKAKLRKITTKEEAESILEEIRNANSLHSD
jgi:hypothetical protein